MSETETIRLTRLMPTASTASAACWTATEIEVPAQLGPVRLIREIGRGGMGVVWLGHDDMLDRDVAVKFLLDAVTSKDDPDFARFLEGARAAAAIRHPGLTTIYQIDLVQGVPYLVMEYVNGPTLAQVLARHGPLRVPQALAIMLKVCEPIAELHDRGIVHRDIKPGNIMLNAAGDVFVTDFGLACDRVPLGSAIAVKGLAGTPAYMAPEMFDGTVSPRSDVYALGVTLFGMLSGRIPYESRADRKGHNHQTLPLELLLQKDVSPPVIELIERATRQDSKFRLKTARHLADSLRQQAIRSLASEYGSNGLAALVSRQSDLVGGTVPNKIGEFPTRLSELAERRRSNNAARLLVAARRLAPFAFGAIANDLTCIRCGYSLRGTPSNGVCPECGTTVNASAGADRLCFNQTHWLRQTRQGIHLLRIALPIWISFELLFVAALRWMNTNELFEKNSTIEIVIGYALSVPLVLLFGAGTWLVTVQEVDATGAVRGSNTRSFCRLVIFVTLAWSLCPTWQVPTALAFLGWFAVAVMSLVLHLAGFADRIPNRSLASMAAASLLLMGLTVLLELGRSGSIILREIGIMCFIVLICRGHRGTTLFRGSSVDRAAIGLLAILLLAAAASETPAMQIFLLTTMAFCSLLVLHWFLSGLRKEIHAILESRVDAEMSDSPHL